jgi:hypothetical protein
MANAYQAEYLAEVEQRKEQERLKQEEIAERTKRITERMTQSRRNPSLDPSPPKQRFILPQYDEHCAVVLTRSRFRSAQSSGASLRSPSPTKGKNSFQLKPTSISPPKVGSMA